MDPILKRAVLTVGALLAIPIGLFAVAMAINAVDEDLSLDAKQFLEDAPPPATLPAERNAFYAMLGLRAEAGRDIHAMGVALVAAYHNGLRQNPGGGGQAIDQEAVLGKQLIGFRGDLKQLCTKEMFSCLEHVSNSGVAIAQLLKDNAVLVGRYRGLYGYDAYENTTVLTLSSPLPVFSYYTADLLISDGALKASHGRVVEAFDIVLDDLAFWRRMLPGRQALIEKMIKMGRLTADLRALSELIRLYGVPKSRAQRVAAALEPLTDRERDMVSVIRNEGIIYGSLLSRDAWHVVAGGRPGVGVSLLTLLYQTQASLNRHAQLWALYRELAETPAVKFADRAESLPRRVSELTELHWYDWYNLVGKYIISLGVPDGYGRYPARMHDLEGLRRLVALQLQIKQRAIPDAKIDAFVRDAGAAYRDPYTEQPMRWDPSAHTLSFEGMGGKTTARIEVRL